jgi:CheY-like chemotaxis protein
LYNWGCTCRGVTNGIDALSALDEGRFDLILMDVSMPDLDGYETTRIIRRRDTASSARIPIIAMTAHALQGDRDRCLEVGMDDYISKPISAAELLEKIRRWAVNRVRARKARDSVYLVLFGIFRLFHTKIAWWKNVLSVNMPLIKIQR